MLCARFRNPGYGPRRRGFGAYVREIALDTSTATNTGGIGTIDGFPPKVTQTLHAVTGYRVTHVCSWEVAAISQQRSGDIHGAGCGNRTAFTVRRRWLDRIHRDLQCRCDAVRRHMGHRDLRLRHRRASIHDVHSSRLSISRPSIVAFTMHGLGEARRDFADRIRSDISACAEPVTVSAPSTHGARLPVLRC